MKTTVDEPEPGLPAPDDVQAPLVAVEHLAQDLRRALMVYKFGIDEMMTKINILREEFTYAREYNPIEHVKSRLKSPESILAKAERKGAPASLDASARPSATSPASASRAASHRTSTGSST